jgi:hypothetical protein
LTTFSPTDAALEGFRITREKPRVLLVWASFNLIISLIMGVALVGLFGPTLMELEAMSGQGSEDPAEALAMLQKLGPLYTLMIPAGLLVIAVTSAAVYRIVLRPSDSRYGYLRLGADELRLVGLMLIYLVLAIGFTFAVTLAAGLLAAGAGAIGGGAGTLLGVLILLATLAFMTFVAVRLSLAGPMTFAQGRLRVFESWTLTRGNFWRLLGAYVLALVLALIVAVLALVIYAAIAAITVGGDLSQVGRVFQPDMSSIGSYFTVSMLIYMVFGAFLSAVQNAVIYAPPAVAYRELTGAGEG